MMAAAYCSDDLRPRIGFGDVANILSMWATKRLSTWDIAQSLHIHEADVERVIHYDRETRRRYAQ